MDTHYASVVLPTAESTQDEAAARFTGDPLLVVADHQTKGRGRFDRTWFEPDRAMFASLAFAPSWPPDVWGLIPLVAGLAMRDAISETTALDVVLRWPNDIVVGSGKVGGILSEASGTRVVVGCGVNLFWKDAIDGAASLFIVDPGPDAAAELAATWTRSLLARVAADPENWGKQEYEAACVTLGHEVVYERGSGVAVGIDDSGALMVDTGDGVIAVRSSEIRLSATLPTPPFSGGAATEEPA